MRNRRLGATLLVSAALLVTACTTGSSASSSAGPTPTPNPCAGAAAAPPIRHRRIGRKPRSAWPPTSARWTTRTSTSTPTRAPWRAPADLGVTATVASVVPKDSSEYIKNITASSTQGYNIIVTVGFNLRPPRSRRPRSTRASGSSVSTSRRSASPRPARSTRTFACKGDAGHPSAELHRAPVSGGPGRLPRRDGRGLGQQDRQHRARSAAQASAGRASATSRAISWAPSRSTRTSRCTRRT